MFKRVWSVIPVFSIGAALVLTAVPSAASAAIIADSVADFTADQSQGYNGWTYLEDRDDAVPTLMDVASNGYGLPNPSWSHSTDTGHYYTTLWNSGAHPGGGIAGSPGTVAAVRRWTSTVTGLVDITGTTHLQEPATIFTNGTSVGIYLNGVLLPGGTGSTINMSPTDAINPTPAFSFTNVSITTGDTIDFILYGGLNLTFGSNIQSDTTDLAAQINTVPEPASLGLLAIGAALALSRRKRV